MGTINGIAYTTLQPILDWYYSVPGWMTFAIVIVVIIFGLKFNFK